MAAIKADAFCASTSGDNWGTEFFEPSISLYEAYAENESVPADTALNVQIKLCEAPAASEPMVSARGAMGVTGEPMLIIWTLAVTFAGASVAAVPLFVTVSTTCMSCPVDTTICETERSFARYAEFTTCMLFEV